MKELHLRRLDKGIFFAAIAGTVAMAILNPPWLPYLIGLMPLGAFL